MFFFVVVKISMENLKILSKIFPNSKYLVMIRKVESFSNYTDENYVNTWNRYMNITYQICKGLNEKDKDDRCKLIYYDNLIRNPNITITNIRKFLNKNWFNSTYVSF